MDHGSYGNAFDVAPKQPKKIQGGEAEKLEGLENKTFPKKTPWK